MRRQIAARVPDDTYERLRALTAVLRTSQADVLERALRAFEATLRPTQRKTVQLLGKQASRS